MKFRRHNPPPEDTGIDLAPMLDFVMNLLIFFIITTSFIKEAGIQVDRGLAVRSIGDFYRDEPVWDPIRTDPRFADLERRTSRRDHQHPPASFPLRCKAPGRRKVSQRGVCLLADPSCDGWGFN